MTLPGLSAGSLHAGAHSAAPSAGPQDPGLHGTAPARPVFYVHAPPPPPFLHYQWPMPFPYNPFAGFPGMGYGMVMPPFPPPPYMDPSAYLFPQPHLPAVDYRRMPHPQVHAPAATFYNPSQARRARPPPVVQPRETTNSEVQTEPLRRDAGGFGGGSLPVSSDSGNGTASNSPSSSSSPLTRGPASVETHAVEHFHFTEAGVRAKHGIKVLHPAKTVHSRIRAAMETGALHHENVPPCSARCNMWSVSSPESMIPICSSSQEESEVAKERRASIPDILMSWGGGTPQTKVVKMADKVLPYNNQTGREHEVPLYQSPAVSQPAPVAAQGTGDDDDDDEAVGVLSSEASEALFKLLRRPLALSETGGDTGLMELDSTLRSCLPCREQLLLSQKKSCDVSHEHEDGGDAPEVVHSPMPFHGCQSRKLLNESVWSVESLPLFIPSKDWLLQNSMLGAEVIVEMTEEAEPCERSTGSGSPVVKAAKVKPGSQQSPSADSHPASDGRPTLSPPACTPCSTKVPPGDVMFTSDRKGPAQGQGVTPENDPSAVIEALQSEVTSPSIAKEEEEEDGSSEPEACQSPNQEPLTETETKQKTAGPLGHKANVCPKPTLREASAPAQRLVGPNMDEPELDSDSQSKLSCVRREQLCAPAAEHSATEVSPSKAHLVDCGLQCELCYCNATSADVETKRTHHFKYSDVKLGIKGQEEGFAVDGHVQKNQRRPKHWRNRGPERYHRQQEAFSSYYSKSGKSKGGSGRNLGAEY